MEKNLEKLLKRIYESIWKCLCRTWGHMWGTWKAYGEYAGNLKRGTFFTIRLKKNLFCIRSIQKNKLDPEEEKTISLGSVHLKSSLYLGYVRHEHGLSVCNDAAMVLSKLLCSNGKHEKLDVYFLSSLWTICWCRSVLILLKLANSPFWCYGDDL